MDAGRRPVPPRVRLGWSGAGRTRHSDHPRAGGVIVGAQRRSACDERVLAVHGPGRARSARSRLRTSRPSRSARGSCMLQSTGAASLNSDVILDLPGPGNNTAFGHCVLDFATGPGCARSQAGQGSSHTSRRGGRLLPRRAQLGLGRTVQPQSARLNREGLTGIAAREFLTPLLLPRALPAYPCGPYSASATTCSPSSVSVSASS